MEDYLIIFFAVLSAEIISERAIALFAESRRRKKAKEREEFMKYGPKGPASEDETAAFDILCAYDIDAAYGRRKGGREN